MTLILSEVTSRWALQVSDRLLTVTKPSGVQSFDKLSNKSVIVHARDGVAALSYTGLAYLKGVPTDSWIACQVNGDEFPFDPIAQNFLSRTGIRRTRWPRLGFLLGSLANRLTEMVNDADVGLSKAPVSIAVAGWFWYRKKWPRPFIALIAPDRSGKRYGIDWSPRRYGSHYQAMPLPSPYLTLFEWQQLNARLAMLGLSEAEDVLISTIQMVAARTETVGADCMAISISHPWSESRVIKTTFMRNAGSVPAQPTTVPSFAAYTPWVIGPHECIAPSLRIGCNFSMDVGFYSISFEGFTAQGESGESPLATIGPQARKHFP